MSFERRKSRVGTVVSNRMDQTVVVAVEWRAPHLLYKKPVKHRTRFKAHDRENQCRIGDVVRIMETRPLSKTKRWRVADILARKEIAEIQPEEIVIDDLTNGDDSVEHLPEARDEVGTSLDEAGEIGVAVAAEAVGAEPDEETQSESAEDEAVAELEVVEQEEAISPDSEVEPAIAVSAEESSQESGDDEPVGTDDEEQAVAQLDQEEAVDVTADTQTEEEIPAQDSEEEAAVAQLDQGEAADVTADTQTEEEIPAQGSEEEAASGQLDQEDAVDETGDTQTEEENNPAQDSEEEAASEPDQQEGEEERSSE